MNEAAVREVLGKYLTDELVNQLMTEVAELEKDEQINVEIETKITIGR